MEDCDVDIDEVNGQVQLTDLGHDKSEKLFLDNGLLDSSQSAYNGNHIRLWHYLSACLKAHYIYKKDKQYLVHQGQVVIIDEHSGRPAFGRRWGDGLHQALEAKEGLDVQPENQALAQITFQNFFNLFDTLSGMTGTAMTESIELLEIYGLDVVVIPTHKPVKRVDHDDLIFINSDAKFRAICKEIEQTHQTGQPILVGTVTVQDSEHLSTILTEKNIEHNVLNAKHHEQEAAIIAEAGRFGRVTIATNMAGRGVDILLGGSKDNTDWQSENDKVLKLGGLKVIGSQRHESRRIDDQLRGRSGRQGDPGSSQYYISFEDDLIRLFANDFMKSKVAQMSESSGEDYVFQGKMFSKSIANAQRRVEGHNYDIRKQLLRFDEISNYQRQVIYEQRQDCLAVDDIYSVIIDMKDSFISELMKTYAPADDLVENWDVEGLAEVLENDFMIALPLDQLVKDVNMDHELLKAKLSELFINHLDGAFKSMPDYLSSKVWKMALVYILDQQWQDHLKVMEYLRQGIHLRGYAGKNPQQEYKRECEQLFSDLLVNIKRHVLSALMQIMFVKTSENEVTLRAPEKYRGFIQVLAENTSESQEVSQSHAVAQGPGQLSSGNKQVVSRNAICGCGSGKKYRHCCGKI